MLSRRRLLRSVVALSAARCVPAALAFSPENTAIVRLQRISPVPLATVPANFIGLGYEMSSVSRPGLLSSHNDVYGQLVRNLGPAGVLRLGGIVADYTHYAAQGSARSEPKDTVVTRASLEQLRGFLDACGWQALWSLNFAHGTLAEAIDEARDVQAVLGPRLLAVELGNEVENYGKGQAPVRPAPYTYEAWRAEYTRWHAALLEAVPGLQFAAPDTAASVEWVERAAADARGDVQLLTTHYYRGAQQQGTQQQLLTPDPALLAELQRLGRASLSSRLPWRMCETNSFFGGGRPGVSDTFAGALWTLNYLLLLARWRCAGVNLETGVNQLGFVSSYSPIQDDNAGHNSAGVPYYGMLAFRLATEGAPEIYESKLALADAGVTAYLLGSGGQIRSVALINASTDRTVEVDLTDLALGPVSVLRLSAPSLEAHDGVTLGGRAVAADGSWSPKPTARESARERVAVPPASATVLRTA